MKRAITFICILMSGVVLAVLLCVLLAEPPEEIVVPPNRFGEKSASIMYDFTFEEVAKAADAIAHVRVGNWLGYNNDNWTVSFEAEVITAYKGDIPQDFVLLQDGNEDSAINNFPLFTYGNELLLFLGKAESNDAFGVTYYEDSYYIRGVHTTVYYVSQDSSGASYAVPSFSNYLHKDEAFVNYAREATEVGSIGMEVAQTLSASDPEVWSGAQTPPRVYSLDEIGNRAKEVSDLAVVENGGMIS